MKRFILPGLAAILSSTFLGCTTPRKAESDTFSMGGVPQWLADGAQLDSEPGPVRPDPAIIVYEDESDPINFELITDRRTYKQPPVKKKTSSADPLERGRDYRIRRLFR